MDSYKVTLSFDLSNPEEAESYRRVVLATEMAGLLYNIENKLLPGLYDKINSGTRYSGMDVLNHIRESIFQEMIDNGINLEKIYS